MRTATATIGLLSSALLALACSGEPASEPGSAREPGSQPQAQALLADLRQRFVLAPARLDGPHAEAGTAQAQALLRPSQAERWEQANGWLVPRIADTHRRGITRPARVRLPLRASGGFELTDDTSGMRLVVRRLGASEAGAEQADGWAVFRGGLAAGGDVLHRATAEGTEDFVHLAQKPEREELRYRIEVSAVAGLRLVSNVLEFVDGSGDPRLRMTAPALVDGAGERRELRIAVEGCAFSSDPAPPWGRPVVAPGASECEVSVSWQPGASYPLLVDPTWSATGNLVHARYRHTSSALPDGKVLLVGGDENQGSLTSEVWANGTFAASSNMVHPRSFHTAKTLLDGRVLVVGGSASPTTSEVWANGSWTASGNLVNPRDLVHAESVLPDGRVLVVGGSASPTTSEVWTNGSWSASGNLNKIPGFGQVTTSVLPDGRALTVFGTDNGQASEIWTNGTWAISGSPLGENVMPKTLHALPDGRALLVGGGQPSEIWTNGTFSKSGNLQQLRSLETSSLLPDGRVIVVGGIGLGAATSEVWDNGTWTSLNKLIRKRTGNAQSTLPDGRVLITGGDYGDNTTAEIWSTKELPPGQLCAEPQTCSSKNCVDGVCCDKPCTGACEACVKAKTGQPDGTCAPIPAGTDPDNECALLNAGVCKASGVCDGKGACESNKGTPCGSSKCQSDGVEFNPPFCDDKGTCLPASGTTDCAPFVCANGGCLTSCTSSVDCKQGHFCENGQCKATSEVGKTCSQNAECALGFCVDGFCCDEACTGSCRACSAAKKGYGQDGTCQDITADTDPDNDCPEQTPDSCQFTGTCDGKGACSQFPSGTSCGPTACEGGKVTGQVCDGQGTCKTALQPVSCFPYLLCADASVCATECASDNQCDPAFHCDTTTNPPTCVKDKIDGASCAKSGECASGHCTDGVCCEDQCGGACQTCKALDGEPATLNGVCRVLPKGTATQSGHPSCGAGDAGCQSFCDGSSAECVFPAQGSSCAPASCSASDVVQQERTCDGAGKCEAAKETNCAPFACDAASGACKTKCNGNADCSTGATCAANGQCTVAGGSCADAVTAKGPDGTLTDCRPYTCLNGQCRDACAKSSECADGFECVEQTCQKQGAGGSAGASGQGGSGGQGGSSGNGGTSGSSASGSGGSASGQGGSGGQGGAGAGGASAPAAAEASDDGGCGCRAAGSSQPGALPAALLAFAAAAARRRRRSL